MRNRDDLRHRSTAPPETEGTSVLTTIIGINCAAYLLRRLFALEVPADLPPAGYISQLQLQQGNWWTVVTHLFVHQDLFHLVSNLALLWLVGRSVLDKLGASNFTYLYLIGGWVGTALELFGGVHGAEAQIIGASGAVFSVMGAFAVLNPDYSLTEPFHRWVNFQLHARTVILCTLFVECLMAGLQFLPNSDPRWPGMSVSHLCHVGGGVFGLLMAWHLRTLLSPSSRGLQTRSPRFQTEFPSDEDHLPFVPVRQSLRAQGAREHGPASFAAPNPESVSDQEFIQQNVNPILEKLHERGFSSLTAEEKRILEEAAQRLGK